MTIKRTLRVRDLLSGRPQSFNRPFLHCRWCGGEYSAHRGDYFAAHPNTVLRCCGQPLRLVVKLTEYRRIA